MENALNFFQISESSYDEAIELLNKWFGRQQEIKFAHINEILNSKQATNINQLKQTVNIIEANLRSLNSLGLRETENLEIFTCIPLSKIPEQTKANLIRKKGDKVWDLKELRELLEDKLRANKWTINDYFEKPKPKQNYSSSSTQNLIIASKYIKICAFYQQNHFFQWM